MLTINTATTDMRVLLMKLERKPHITSLTASDVMNMDKAVPRTANIINITINPNTQ